MIRSTATPGAKPGTKTPIRMAIYTRKSTDENLDDEMNSLEVQRETAEAYIASQKAEGWVALPQRYDDGNCSGGNTDRPAFKRLMADIEAGRVDGIVVYKLDRLSRSILDFAKMMEVFDTRGIALVSVTQQFNTSTSLGRLIVHILLSFAQFEREQIAERIRDKMAACRRRGKWVGGSVPMGYKVAEGGGRLVVDEDDAERVRAIFDLYLEHGAVMDVVSELLARDWTTPCRTNRRRSEEADGQTTTVETDAPPTSSPSPSPSPSPPVPPTRKPFDRAAICRILTNPTYIGKVNYKGEIHQGEQEAIIAPEVWKRAQAIMAGNSRNRGCQRVNKGGALLRGLLYCKTCGRAMTHVWTTRRKGSKRYRYYVCGGATQNGWDSCPSKSLPAGEVEEYVLGYLERLGRDRDLTEQVARRAADEWGAEGRRRERDADAARMDKRLAERDARQAAEARDAAGLAEAQERRGRAEARLAEAREAIARAESHPATPGDMAALFARFREAWGELSLDERERVLRLLISKVTYDGASSRIGITFRTGELPTLNAWVESLTAPSNPAALSATRAAT